LICGQRKTAEGAATHFDGIEYQTVFSTYIKNTPFLSLNGGCRMIGILKYSGVKTDTLRFRAYRKVAVATLIDEHGVSKQKARTLSALLEILESHRVSYSKGAYRFQTKRVSSEVLADELGVTKRYLRMLLRILEATGIITIRRRRVGRFMNLWNAFEFTRFIEWLTVIHSLAAPQFPLKKKVILDYHLGNWHFRLRISRVLTRVTHFGG
jgi:DNA-binding MarR family transcriptional regulator